MEFKVIKLDRKRNNVVLSRRAVVEASMGEERAKLMETLREGAIVHGVVKNITEYGAFVDLGGIDGLLHITDMAWRRVRHPSEVVQVGQELDAKVLKFDAEKNRVSLGIKQLGDDPWHGVSRRYPQGTRLFGKVTNIADYGAFVEIEPGIEGLVHVSEMDWTNKNVAPSKMVSLGEEVEVMVLEIDEDKRRIIARHEAVQGQSVGGVFRHGAARRPRQGPRQVDHRLRRVRRPGGRHRRPGAPLRPVVERAGRTGGAQLQEGPGGRGDRAGRRRRPRAHLARHQAARQRSVHQLQLGQRPRRDWSPARSKSVDARGAEIQLNDDVTGYLRASEISRDRVEDARNVLKEGDEVNGHDHQRRPQGAFDPAVDQGQGQRRRTQEAHAAPVSRPSERENAGTTSLGALLRAKLDNQNPTPEPQPASRGLHDPFGSRGAAGRALRPADPSRHRVRGQDDPRCDGLRALARGHRIEIRGFGSFSINRRPPRVGRNPRSGEQVVISEKLVPHFKPGKALARSGRRPRRRQARRSRAEAAEPPHAPLPATRQLASPDAMRTLVWLFRAAVFFTLFAFALNNQRRGEHPLVLRLRPGARRWSSSSWPRSASAAPSASSRWCRAGGGTAACRAPSMRRAEDRLGRRRAAAGRAEPPSCIRRAMDFEPAVAAAVALPLGVRARLARLAPRRAPVPA